MNTAITPGENSRAKYFPAPLKPIMTVMIPAMAIPTAKLPPITSNGVP